MKVKELIKKLRKCNPNAKVISDHNNTMNDFDRVLVIKGGDKVLLLEIYTNTSLPIEKEIE